MEPTKVKAFVVYLSPAGSTKRAANIIVEALRAAGIEPLILDLKETDRSPEFFDRLTEAGTNALLFVGTPVYVGHAVPPVDTFLQKISMLGKGTAVPFAVWGAVCSGLTLMEMAGKLIQKGFAIGGAAGILGQHSQMWFCEEPLAKGHPNKADAELLKKLVAEVLKNLFSPDPRGLSLEALNYLPEPVQKMFQQNNLAKAAQHLPRRIVKQETCTKCGTCLNVCPVGAIAYTPYPVFQKHCILCFNCVRCCPEKAIEADVAKVATMVRQRAEAHMETPESRLFLP